MEPDMSLSIVTTPTESLDTAMISSMDEKIDSAVTDDLEEMENLPPLLHPDPSRMVSCLRAPCLKKQHILGQGVGSGSSSPLLTSTSVPQPTVYSFTGIKTLSGSASLRHVHFDAAPPEAGLTYSGDRYDRRPIECTQGGSQADLSLPPRGKCPSYAGDADDELCEDEDDDDSKHIRLGACAKWARLKNGGGIFAGLSSNRRETAKKDSEEEDETVKNACSTPVHGIRAFGGLAGRSGLTTAEEKGTGERAQRDCKEVIDLADEDVKKDDSQRDTTTGLTNPSLSEGANEENIDDDDFESEERHEAFRKAVLAALSRDPNATPMPSPSVRPRWECVTSYFEPEGEEKKMEKTEKEEDAISVANLDQEEPQEESKEEANQDAKLSTLESHGANKVANWTEAQANQIGDSSKMIEPSTSQNIFNLTLPAPKLSPSASCEGSNLTNLSSSPMSSRGSSSDAWGSESNVGHWSESEHDAFDAAFMHSNNDGSIENTQGFQAKVHSQTPILAIPESDIHAPTQEEATPTQTERVLTQSVCVGNESDHHDGEHTSSSSSGGGAGWFSSCCTSPELSPSDLHHTSIYGANSPVSSLGSASVKMALMQQCTPFELERINNVALEIEKKKMAIGAVGDIVSHLSLPNSGINTPLSGQCSPQQLYSGDEDEGSRRSTSPLRCPNKKTRKTRRMASGSDVVRDEIGSEDGSTPRSNGTLRSKSMSHSSGMKRTTSSSLKKSSVFQSDFDDEGALGGF